MGKPSPLKEKTSRASSRAEAWTHLDTQGKARMVDVSLKKVTRREAWATGTIQLRAETLEGIQKNEIKKGDVLNVARVAAILAAKKTSDLIPLCHPLKITQVEINFSLEKNPPRVRLLSRVQAADRTGVEMEALTAVAAAALTIYDMCKAIDREMLITDIGLLKKTGGKSGTYLRKGPIPPGKVGEHLGERP